MNKVVILGASGHAKVIADIILKSGEELIGFLDDNTALPSQIIGYPYLGKITHYEKYADECCFVIGIGSNSIRKKIAESMNVNWYTAIHPSAQIAIDTVISEGTVVMANAVINTSAVIGKHCIINTGAVIEHDNVIGDYVHISPNVSLCGNVNIGDLTHIGAGASVKNMVSICAECTIGVGAVVIRNIDIPGTYIGVPAIKKA